MNSIIDIIITPVGCWSVGGLAENSQAGVGRAETSFDYHHHDVYLRNNHNNHNYYHRQPIHRVGHPFSGILITIKQIGLGDRFWLMIVIVF